LAGENLPLILGTHSTKENTSMSIAFFNGKVRISSSNIPVTSIKVFDIVGKQILEETGKNISDVDVSHLAKGIYIAEAKNAENEKITLKFSK
jgi:hypothetical protein